jgi:hypothetical protein
MSAKMKVAFAGCSMSRGDGFDMSYLAPEIWPNIVSQVFDFDSRNLGISGASNLRIFQTASTAILSKKYDLVFCQWTVLDRLWLSPGPDVWYFLTGDGKDSFEYRDVKLNQQEKTDLEHMITQLNHDYQNIIELVDYVNVLEDLARYHQVKIAHVNGMVPWQSDLADENTANDFSIMSEYTRQLLNFDNRDDTEIQQLFLKLHKKFIQMNPQHWINLFDSFQSQTVDAGPLGHHPGPRSHVSMSNLVRNYLKKGLL